MSVYNNVLVDGVNKEKKLSNRVDNANIDVKIG